MKKSESIAKLAEALAKAQAEIGFSAMNGKNPHFNSKYSTLASVVDAVKPIHKHGLSFVQTAEIVPSESGCRVEITSLLMHASGEWIESLISMKPRLDDPQAVGSAISYGRRYSLAALVGIASDDDDGNAASAKKVVEAVNKPAAKKIVEVKPTVPPETTLPATKTPLKANPIDVPTVSRINGLLGALKIDGAEAKHGAVAAIVGHEFTVPADLTMDEGLAIIKSLEGDLVRKEAAK